MTTAHNKAIVQRLFDEVLNQGNVSVVDALYDPNFVDHSAFPGQTAGPAGIKEAIAEFRLLFPDLHATIEQMVAEGDLVATREVWRGTYAPTGDAVSGAVLHIFGFRNGKIAQEWSAGWEWLTRLTAA